MEQRDPNQAWKDEPLEVEHTGDRFQAGKHETRWKGSKPGNIKAKLWVVLTAGNNSEAQHTMRGLLGLSTYEIHHHEHFSSIWNYLMSVGISNVDTSLTRVLKESWKAVLKTSLFLALGGKERDTKFFTTIFSQQTFPSDNATTNPSSWLPWNEIRPNQKQHNFRDCME